jgi:hypothetical protein
MPTLPDFKDRDGKWVKKAACGPKSVFTHSFRKWSNLLQRCKEGGTIQQAFPTYIGCTNEFGSFEEFMDWHVKQVGYGSEHQIDKDLLVRGNKMYGPETCLLVPKSINMIVTARCKPSTGLPAGVSFDKRVSGRKNKYRADFGERRLLGVYATAEEAFAAYRHYKESRMKALAQEFKSVIDPRAYAALMNYEVTPY